jgi:hypothetical protein
MCSLLVISEVHVAHYCFYCSVLLFIVCPDLISFVHCIVCPLTVSHHPFRQTVAFMAFCAMIYNDIRCVIF